MLPNLNKRPKWVLYSLCLIFLCVLSDYSWAGYYFKNGPPTYSCKTYKSGHSSKHTHFKDSTVDSGTTFDMGTADNDVE